MLDCWSRLDACDVGMWMTWTCSQQRWLSRELKAASLDRHSLVYLAGSSLICVAVIATGMRTPDLFSLPKVCYCQQIIVKVPLTMSYFYSFVLCILCLMLLRRRNK